MQVNSNISSMLQLEKKLEQSASALSKLNLNSEDSSAKQQKNVRHNSSHSQDDNNKESNEKQQNPYAQQQTALAYSVNSGNVVSVQNSIQHTTIDIKV
ncbi:MAG: hypothetical protein U9Q33_09820 [Campylobacterota bacterium]|nr:hypothetical protein [Campylobacterota bacterium]